MGQYHWYDLPPGAANAVLDASAPLDLSKIDSSVSFGYSPWGYGVDWGGDTVAFRGDHRLTFDTYYNGPDFAGGAIPVSGTFEDDPCTFTAAGMVANHSGLWLVTVEVDFDITLTQPAVLQFNNQISFMVPPGYASWTQQTLMALVFGQYSSIQPKFIPHDDDSAAQQVYAAMGMAPLMVSPTG